MADTLSPERRSQLMGRIRPKDTKPEMTVRRLLHGLGYRYMLHDARLPGKPDLVFPSRRKVLFVHGCFWHGHSCSIAPTPKSNNHYWGPKIDGNIRRDARNVAALRRNGWSVAVAWECQTKPLRLERLVNRLVRFLA